MRNKYFQIPCDLISLICYFLQKSPFKSHHILGKKKKINESLFFFREISVQNKTDQKIREGLNCARKYGTYKLINTTLFHMYLATAIFREIYRFFF